jgi:hypothetical protein
MRASSGWFRLLELGKRGLIVGYGQDHIRTLCTLCDIFAEQGS